MGIRIQVGDWTFQATDYSVEESATPLSTADASGSVGTLGFTIPTPDPDAPTSGVLDTGWAAVKKFGADILLDKTVTITDSRRGFTLGTVSAASRNDDSGSLSISCVSELGILNAYGVQSAPLHGTLSTAFTQYMNMAGIYSGYFVDPEIADKEIVFPGWNGELWFNLKQMAAAMDCDISLVSGIYLLRPIRKRVATRGRDISRTRDLPLPSLAQAIEVYLYNNVWHDEFPVYPPGGWTPETEVLNVNAGETATYTLELSASVSNIVTPSFSTSVAPDYNAGSVYTVIADDGLPVTEDEWTSHGGSVIVTVNPDTVSLNVELKGATGLPLATGGAATNFALALASDTTGNRYSTLRILGVEGVEFTKEKRRIRTGVPPTRTSTDVGMTIDNPFISTVDDLYTTGTRAARRFAGPVPTLSGNVLAINKLGDSGVATYPTYAATEDALHDLVSPTATYDDVENYYTVDVGITSYGQVQSFWFEFVQDDFTNQVFGNVNGARIFDKKSRHWYRIRSATLGPESISFDAEDDLTHGDMEGFHVSRTYGDVELILSGLTYRQAELVGMYDGNN